MRQIKVLGNAVIKRRQDAADRSRVDAAIGMAADPAVDWARIQARSAADALKALAERRRQHLGAAIVEQDEMKLLRSVELAWLFRPRDQRGVNRQRLPRRGPRQQFQ